jgi:tetratricopeptide (TPR) repeat protein
VALAAYANLDKDSGEAIDILKEALSIDSNYALAHWIFGEKVREADRRMAEWKQAVNLAPRNYEWAAKYAQLCLDEQQYAEAGRAWAAAARAAPDDATRERYLTLRSGIEGKRLDAEEAERREVAAVKAREIEDLKAKARKELTQLEARANTKPLSADPPRPTVDWYDTDSDAKISGLLVRVNCTGKQLRLDVKDDQGKTQSLLVSDPAQLVIQGGDGKLTCGAQKPARVDIAYRKPKDAKAGVIGEATGIEFNP